MTAGALDLGSIVGTVALDDVQFQSTYVRVSRQFASLGRDGEAASAGTSKLDASMAGVADSSNAASASLTRTNTALREAGVSASRAASGVDALGVAESRAAGATTELGLAQSKAAQAALRQTAAQERLDALQASGTATTRQLASAQASLIAANDRVALSSERVGKSQMLGAQTADRIGSAWAAVPGPVKVAGAAVALALAAAGHAAAEFDSKMALVQSLSRASASEMGQLRSAALNVGQAYGFTANQVADAEAELIKAGVSVKDIMGGALTGALTLASAGQENVAQATETATIAMTQFGLAGKDVPHIADLLAAGADKALGSVADLSEALKFGGLAAHQAGFNINETVGTLAEFAQAGLQGSSAGSTLQQMLRSLEHATPAAAATMKQYGVEVYNANGTMKSATQIAGELHDKILPLAPAQRNAALATIFSARAVRGATILMQGGAAATQHWIDTVNAQGFAAQQASGKLNSLSGDWLKFKAALQTALIDTGEAAMPVLRGIVQGATDVLGAMMSLGHGIGDVVHYFEDNKAAAAGLALVLTGALAPAIARTVTEFGALALENVVASLTAMRVAVFEVAGAFTAAGGSAVGFGAALDTLDLNPIGAAIALIGGAIAILPHLFSEAGAGANSSQQDINNWISALAGAGAKSRTDIADLAVNVEAFSGSLTDMQGQTVDADKALASLVTSRRADQAASQFKSISAALQAQGVPLSTISQLFPHYNDALQASSTSAKEAGTGIDQYGNAVSAAAKKMQEATQAAQDYQDALHALTDPLFAMNQALQDLKAKQKQAADDLQKYGAKSRQVKQDNLALAQSAVGVSAAASTLATSVKDGSTSVSTFRRQLKAWVADGAITKSQAVSIAGSIGVIIGKAQKWSHIDAKAKITADTGGAKKSLDSFAKQAPASARRAGSGFSNTLNATLKPSQAALNGVGKQIAAVGAMHVHPTVTVQTSQAQAALHNLLGTLQGIASHVWTATVTTIHNLITHTSSGKGADGGLVPDQLKFASGGFAGPVHGPGGPRSDLVPALLSNGEYVMPADKTARFLPYLQAMRAGAAMPASAWGGPSKTPGGGHASGGGHSGGHGDGAQQLGGAVKAAIARVYAVIAAAVRPTPTDINTLSSMLHRQTRSTVELEKTLPGLKRHYQDLKQAAKDAAHAANQLANAQNQSKSAADKHAQALSDEASKAHQAAANMSGAGKAAAAAKAAAEKHARALDQEARKAREDAASISKSNQSKANSAQKAADAAQKAADKAKKAYDEEKQAAQAAAQKAAQTASTLVQQLQTNADALAQQVSDFMSSIQSGITGDNSLSSIWQALAGTDDSGNPINPTLDEVQGSLDSILANAKQFAADLNKILAEGGGQDLISQLAAMGTTAGDALAQQLLAAGPDAIKAMQTTMAGINSVAVGESELLGKAFFGAGALMMVKLLEGLEKAFPALREALKPIIDELANMFGDAGTAGGQKMGAGILSGLYGSLAAVGPSSGKPISYGGYGPATPGPLSGLGGFPVGAIPHFAGGGTDVAGGMALVGERGPEIVDLPPMARIWRHGTGPRGGDGASLSDVVSRLDAIESRLAGAPTAHAEALSVPMSRAATQFARTSTRDRRAGR